MSRSQQRSSVSEDPTAWVLETYPWSQPSPTALVRLKPECSDSSDHSNRSQSASNRSLPATSANSEDHLVS